MACTVCLVIKVGYVSGCHRKKHSKTGTTSGHKTKQAGCKARQTYKTSRLTRQSGEEDRLARQSGNADRLTRLPS
jgi:hypothetical protein